MCPLLNAVTFYEKPIRENFHSRLEKEKTINKIDPISSEELEITLSAWPKVSLYVLFYDTKSSIFY